MQIVTMKLTLVIAAVGALSFSAHATIWANQPRMEFPVAAIADCIDGKVVVQFHVVNGHPVDMQIVSSEPDGLYTSSFLSWWNEYDKWRRHVGMRWDDDTAESDVKEISFDFRPCEE